MKKTLSFMVMALALLLTQCRKPEVKFPTPSSAEGVTVSMTVTAGPGSKTDITTEGAITWSDGDKLYVGYNDAYVGCLELVSGGSATGTFTGNVTLPVGTTDGEKEFRFFYLGSTPLAVPNGANSAIVSFASQDIYKNGDKLENAGKHHVGYGTAKGTVAGSAVTGINVTLVSKVALARFSFTAVTSPYEGELTLSGDHIYNSMTVGFDGTFTGEKTDGGNISLGAGHAERYVMLVPAGTGSKTLNFVGDATGSTTLANGIEANKFYGKESAVEVPLVYKTVNFGTPNLNWSVCNLGAANGLTPASWYGDYYAWGATETWYSAGGQTSSPTWKEGYSDGYTWKYCPGNEGYSSYDEGTFNTWKDANLTDDVLNSDVDAATANCGDGWRMPTRAEWKALYDNNTFEWVAAGESSTKVTSFTAVAAGYLVIKGKNSSLDPTVYMFLPAAGARDGASLDLAGSNGVYWSSSLSTARPPVDAHNAYTMNFSQVSPSPYWDNYRYLGLAVRPVRGGATPEPPAPTGGFTINADGDKVEFAPGNLYWDGTDSKWKFEANQWDFRTYEGRNSCINGSVEEDGTPSGHWGLFGWSTSSTTYGMSTSTSSSDYSGNFKDWGDLAIDGYEANTWHTLTNEEWVYLLLCRDNCYDLYAQVTLEDLDVSGLVILPDGSSDIAAGIVTSSALAASGGVFLPAAGGRVGTDLDGAVGWCGCYWSSTPETLESDYAHTMNFCYSGNVGTVPIDRYYGFAVRLVR